MEIIQGRALQFVTKKHKQISALIPKSKVLAVRGDKAKMLVHWGADEAKVLRNLGIKAVPSLMHKDYAWPGMYEPFDHQRTTAAFLADTPRGFCLNEAGCVDADTEYLSPTGWKRISEYQGGMVAQFDPETGAATFVEPSAYIKKPCTTMVRIQTSKGVDQLLSPEHRVLLYDNATPGAYVVMSAGDVLQRHNQYFAGYRPTRRSKTNPNMMSYSHAAIRPHFEAVGGAGVALTDAELRVQIAVIADGHFPNKSTNCTVRLKHTRKVQRMRQLLTDAAIPFRTREQNTATATGFTVFTFHAPLRTKSFGPEFWAATRHQLAIVRDEVMRWDGCARGGKKGAEFTSTCKQSADFVQYAFAGAGYIARISSDPRAGKYRSGVCYSVYVRHRAGTGLLALHRKHHPGIVRVEPATDGFKYCFSVPSTFLVLRRNGCVFTTGNTGKSMSAAWAADYLMEQGKVRKALIVCPLSIMETAWRADLFRSLMHRSVGVCAGSREQRKAVIAQGYDFTIINFDGAVTLSKELRDQKYDLIIVDEANFIKNPQTNRWKALAGAIHPTTRIWLMTGTPASQSPTDAYGLAKLVNPDSVPLYFNTFRDQVMVKVSPYKYLPRLESTGIVHKVLQPAIRFTKEDCLDLPGIMYTTREVPLTKQQLHYYELIRKTMVATAAATEITALNAAGLLNKLLQVSAGAAYGTEKEVVEFDIKARFDALCEIIEGTDKKVLIFVPFRHVLDQLEERLLAEKYTVGVLHGGVPARQRDAVIKAFQSEADPRLILAQPAAVAHGLTLTEADTVVWWGPIPSAETYLQGNARAYRAGQKNKVTVVRLQGSPVERRMYDMLDGRLDRHNVLVDLFQQEIKGLT